MRKCNPEPDASTRALLPPVPCAARAPSSSVWNSAWALNSSTRGASLEAKGRAPGAVGVDGAAPGVPLPSPAGYFKSLAASAGLELIGKNLNFESPAFYASAGLELIGENLIFEVDLPSTQKSNAGARGNEFHDKSAPA